MDNPIKSFKGLLEAAKMQVDPQRFLMVFAKTLLPEGCSDMEKASYESNNGGVIEPQMCVDKKEKDLTTFTDLCVEADNIQKEWDIVFIACLSDKNDASITDKDIETGLNRMISSIHNGMVSHYMAFNRSGDPLIFH